MAHAYRRLAGAVKFLSRLQILIYDEAAIERFEAFRRQKLRIGRTDLRIAATVLGYDAILVTRNLADFKQVPGLRLEDWSRTTG